MRLRANNNTIKRINKLQWACGLSQEWKVFSVEMHHLPGMHQSFFYRPHALILPILVFTWLLVCYIVAVGCHLLRDIFDGRFSLLTTLVAIPLAVVTHDRSELGVRTCSVILVHVIAVRVASRPGFTQIRTVVRFHITAVRHHG